MLGKNKKKYERWQAMVWHHINNTNNAEEAKNANDKSRVVSGLLLGLGLIFFCSGCAPTVYVVDRHTIMEEEAAGEWPEFDREVAGALVELGPTPLKNDQDQALSDRNRKILNGEMTAHKRQSPHAQGPGQ